MVFGNGLALPFLAGFKDYDGTAEFMRKAWVAFAKSGNPQVVGHGWPPYRQQQAPLSINQTPALIAEPYRQQFPMLEPVIERNWLQAGI